MVIGNGVKLALGAGVWVACATGACASVKGFDISPGAGGALGAPWAVDHTGGTIQSINTRYDSGSHRLDWTVNFADRVTKGFWLVLTNGDAPATSPGRHAIFYFDGTDALDATPTTNIRLTAYGFNGLSTATSWRDGDGNPANDIPRGTSVGDQGDVIHGAFDTGWIFSLTAANTVLPGGINGRTLGFSIDATEIVEHLPRFTGGADPWTGTGFGGRIGISLHPVRSFNAIYDTVDSPTDPTDYGRIRTLSLGMPGGFEGMNLLTYDVPAPGAGVALGLIGVLGRRRRR